VINTELGRHLNQWYIACIRPCFEFVLKTPFYGAQTTLYCTLDDGIECESGMYYSDCAKKNPASQALNKVSILHLHLNFGQKVLSETNGQHSLHTYKNYVRTKIYLYFWQNSWIEFH
jgi:hypothetical protein